MKITRNRSHERLNLNRQQSWAVKERRQTLPPKLKKISDEINDAIQEARRIREMSIQEEVVQELDKVNVTLEEAKKQISKIMNP